MISFHISICSLNPYSFKIYTMAKIKHNNFLDTVDDVFSNAKQEGVLHLHSEGLVLNGNTIKVKGMDLKHFGTTGYLGLEQDKRLKQAAINAISNYGTQFPLSKTYISHPLYLELEEKLSAMYGYPVIITKNSTLGHIAVIPTAVRDEDAVILDHQVHWSVQNATQLLKPRGIPVEMIRHNNLQMLEEKIKKLQSRTSKIWYMADGVYSMYGDFSPIEELMEISRKYPQLHFYFDDVHGMSWKGNNGTGYVLDILKGKLPQNVILVGTLSKTFGASGSVVIFSDNELHRKIKTYGGPLTFSAQLEPASVAAGIAAANIHLSQEIYQLQKELQLRITYFNKLLSQSFLPLISQNDSPVFYIGTGLPVTGYHFVKQLMDNGFFVNLGLFPAVPVKNTGVRITISLHNTLADIDQLFEALEYHYKKALLATGNTIERVAKAFKLSVNPKEVPPAPITDLYIYYYNAIKDIHPNTWNKMVGRNNIMDSEGLQFLEECFKGNSKKEHNWKFHYFLIKDRNQQTVLATFLSESIWKDDMLSPEKVSKAIEEQRQADPYKMTSKVIATGCLFTEGAHLYLDQEHPQKETALRLLLRKIEELADKSGNAMTVLRDFSPKTQVETLLQKQAYIPVSMPDSCVMQNLDWRNEQEFLDRLSKRSRKHFRKDVKPFEDYFDIHIQNKPNSQDLQLYYELYKEVKSKNFGLNTFTYPIRVFEKMALHPNWEFIVLRLKNSQNLAGVMFCYKNQQRVYVPSLIGMDYNYNKEFQTYRQLLYQTIKRAKDLKFKQIDFGFSASFEKRKLGVTIIPKVAYLQANDNFSLEALEWLRKD